MQMTRFFEILCMYLFQVDLTKSLFRNVKVLNMFDEVLNQFSKQDLFHRASRVDRFSLGYVAILDEYRVAANYHKSQRTVACRSELGHIDVRRLIFLVRSASAVRSCSWNSTRALVREFSFAFPALCVYGSVSRVYLPVVVDRDCFTMVEIHLQI